MTQSENTTIELLVKYPTTNVSIALKNKKFGNTSYTETEGANITLTCSVNGFPPPIVEWYKDGVNTKTENLEDKYGRHEHPVGGFSSLYRVTDAGCEDGGTYVCQANNNMALNQSTLHNTVKVEVKCDPVLYDASEQSRVYPLVEGETIVINFTVQAKPKPLLATWTYFGKSDMNLLNNISGYEYRRYSSSNNIYYFEFLHFDVTDNRTGLYSAVLSNGIRYSLNLTYTLSSESQPGTTSSTNTDLNGTTPRNETGVEDYCHDNKCTYIISGSLFLVVLILVLILATALQGPLNVLVRCVAALCYCRCGGEGLRRLWLSVPSNEDINEDDLDYNFVMRKGWVGQGANNAYILNTTMTFGSENVQTTGC
ncbi:titin homolog [Haliotis rubra]|uniref:titin homolog n=1 Tax=Haliotis rubra TaxID=36100 RepID=UPI001EE58518|nr:titin homolog [Haliotis rubra]